MVWALQGAFEGFGRLGSALRILIAASGVGLLTVLTHMLFDEGVGVVETYVVRTGLAATVALIAIHPREVPASAAPRLLLRAVAVTTYFVLVILTVQRGSPVVVQTLVATTPLLILAWESLHSHTWPAPRAIGGALLVLAGVLLVVLI